MTDKRPPPPDPERCAMLQLIRSPRVGPVTFRRLLAAHGSAAAALAALPDIAKAAGAVGYKPCPDSAIAAECARARDKGARLLTLADDAYPTALRDLADSPPVLWALGDARLGQRPGIALVGARNASALGQRMARHLSHALGESGLVVISGLARGIDAAAHAAALDSGTIAVMAGGVDVPYPPENTDLARSIFRKGLLLSEQPMGLVPQARHFPRRNRLISGLSQGLVVVEATARSGSLITARDALDQGREVMAVPAHPFDARSAGTNQLIRDGATLVRSADDVLSVLGALNAPVARDPEGPIRPIATGATSPDRAVPPPMGDVRAAILACLSADPVAEHVLCDAVAAPADHVFRHLTELELDGLVSRHGGGMVSRVA